MRCISSGDRCCDKMGWSGLISIPAGIGIPAETHRNRTEWPERPGLNRNSTRGGTRGCFVPVKWPVRNFPAGNGIHNNVFYDSTKKKKKLFPAFVKVPNYSGFRKKNASYWHYFGKLPRDRKKSKRKNWETKKKKREIQKKRQPVFAALLFEFWPAQVYCLDSVCVLQPWLLPLLHPHQPQNWHMNMRFSLVFVGQKSAQDSPAISLPL